MPYDGISTVLDAMAPSAAATNFPLPKLRTARGPAGVFTYEGPTMNGQLSPGQWLLTGARKEYGWQVIQGNYLQGARLVPTADPVPVITYSIKLWANADVLVYRRMIRSGILSKPIVPLKTPTSGLVAGANLSAAVIDIDDEALADVNIRQVVVKSVTPPYNPLVSSGGKGTWTAEVTFYAWPGSFKAAAPIPDQSIPDQGAVTPGAYNAAAVSGALIVQGDAQRQAQLAKQALPL